MLPFKIETAAEREARRKAAALAQAQGKATPAAVPAVPAMEPIVRPLEPVPAVAETPAVDPRILAAVAPPAKPAVVDPEMEAIRARHANDAPIGDVATTDDDPTVVFRGGRPESATGPDELAAQRALKTTVDAYEPQKVKGLRKWLPILLQAGGVVGGITSNDSRATAANAVGLGRSLGNSRMADENWKAGKQAEVGAQINSIYDQKKSDAALENLKTQKDLRERGMRVREQGINLQGQRVEDARLKAALDYYHKVDYTPGANEALDKYFSDSGLHELPARKAAEKYELKWSNGSLIRVPKGEGEASAVTMKDGKPVVDESKVPNQKVTVNGVTYDNLTSKEAAVLAGRLSEGAANRKSREKIAAGSQAGLDRRSSGKAQSAINPSVKGAVVAISKFRSLTTRIANAKAMGDTATAQALEDERNGHEKMMRQLYGDIVQDDDKGKPTVLNDAYVDSPNIERPTIQGAIDHFKRKNNRAPTAAETARMQAVIDAQ